MAMSINSGKKIKYFDETLASLMAKHKKIETILEDMRVASGNIRAAATDRAYNAVVEMGLYINEGIVAAGHASVDILDELSKLTTVGPALVSEAKRVKVSAEEVAALKLEATKIPSDVIAGRGLDENWTPATMEAFVAATTAFIKVRKDLINDIADFTSRSAEEDFKDVYMTIGRHLEGITNNTVDAYNALREQLEVAGHGLQASVDASVEASGTVGRVGDLNVNTDLTGETMDV